MAVDMGMAAGTAMAVGTATAVEPVEAGMVAGSTVATLSTAVEASMGVVEAFMAEADTAVVIAKRF
jgi:hypothetical protein